MAARLLGGRRVFGWLGALVVLGILALPSGASALTGLSVSGSTLQAQGSGGPDQVTIRFKLDGKGNPTVQIFDAQGIPDPLPAGCSRKDDFTVICPADAYLGVDVHTGNGDDQIID